MWGKNHCSTHRVFELNMNFQILLFFVRPYDISRFLWFKTICVIFGQIFFLHIFVHGVYVKLNMFFFSSPEIICVSWDRISGCPYDIHWIALKWFFLNVCPTLRKASNFFVDVPIISSEKCIHFFLIHHSSPWKFNYQPFSWQWP